MKEKEPIASVLYNDIVQTQILKNDYEDTNIRTSYPQNIKFNHKNIILIVIDALRADHLSLNGYNRKTSPFLDSLYTNGSLTKINLAFSNGGASFGGIMGILRSKTWYNLCINNLSIHDLLKDQGYLIHFLISGDHTNFYNLRSYYGNSLNFYYDGSMTKKYSINDDRLVIDGLRNISDFHQPSFFYFHLNSAHAGGIKLKKYEYFGPTNNLYKDPSNYTNNYDNGILQADHYVKEIFSLLDQKGYLSNSIVIITADHGEALGERGVLGHSKHIYSDQTLIPLLIFDHIEEYKNLKFATQLDIAPTIVDRLGLPIPGTWEGKSLLNDQAEEFVSQHMGEYHSILHYRNNTIIKYLYNNQTKKEELFNLSNDLWETKNIIDSIQFSYLDSLRSRMKIILN